MTQTVRGGLVSVVDGRWIPSTGSFVLRRIFALGFRFEGARGEKS